MEIYPKIRIIGKALYLEKEKILILNDLHLGYEEALHRKGILVPRFQIKEIIEEMNLILKKVKPKKIIINGDLKHEFGRVLDQEWREVLQFLDLIQKHAEEIIIIKGNHDPIIKPIANKRNVKVLSEYKIGEIHIIHGDELVETDAKVIVIGHEHPAITLKEHGKYEKFKCFLKGKWKKKVLIAVPSFNPLLEGTDILKSKLLSPFLTNIDLFEIFIIDKEKVFNFGKLKDIRKHL